MLTLKIFLSDITPVLISFACFATIYEKNEILFGDFSLLLVIAGILAGFATGFADARALKGVKIEIEKVTIRLLLSIVFLIASFIVDSYSTNGALKYILVLITVGFSLSCFELILASALRGQQYRIVIITRTMMSFALVPFVLFLNVGDANLIYAASSIIATFGAAVIWLISKNAYKLSVDIKYIFPVLKTGEIYENVLSLSLRFIGSSPILLAALNSGSEFAGEIFLAQRILAMPIGTTLNFVILPRLITSKNPPAWLDDSSFRRAFVFFAVIVSAGSVYIFSSNIVTLGFISAILLVGSRIYCERLIYFFINHREKSSVWILWIALVDFMILIFFGLFSIGQIPVPLWLASLVALIPSGFLYIWILKFHRVQRSYEYNSGISA